MWLLLLAAHQQEASPQQMKHCPRGMDVCVDPNRTLFSGRTQEHKTSTELGKKKKKKRTKKKASLDHSLNSVEFRFLFRKWCYSLKVPLYFLTSSWPNNQVLAGIAFCSVIFFLFCMLKIISVYLWHFFPQDIKVTYAPSTPTWSQPDCVT